MTRSHDAVNALAVPAQRTRAERWRSSSEIVEFRDSSGVQWRIRREWLGHLAGAAGSPARETLPIDEWIHAPTTTVVKHGPHRSVYRLELDGAVVYLKHDRVLRWTDVVRRILKASPSRREWFNSAELARVGVPTIQPIAFGETIRHGVVRDSYFLSLEIPNSEQLDEFLARSLHTHRDPHDRDRRSELIAALAELCVRCHEAGVDHQDFHAGNILVQTPDDDGALRLFLIDLPAVSFRRPLAWRPTCNSLAMLNTGLRDLTQPYERSAFLKEYFARRTGLVTPAGKAAADEISARTWVLAQSNFHSRDKRACRRNQDFQPHRSSLGAAYAVAEVRRTEAVQVIANHAGESTSTLAPRSNAWRLETLELGGRRRLLACKTYDDWSQGFSWRRFWRWTPGLRRWGVGQALLARGIATPRPWIVWRAKSGANAGRIVVACEWLADALPLDEALHAIQRLPEPLRRATLDAAAKRVGRLLGDMHRWGVAHRDLTASSVLVSIADDVSCSRDAVSASLVNLDHVTLGKREDSALAAADLRRLVSSLAGKASLDARTWRRFLASYLGVFRLSNDERRRRLAELEALIPLDAIRRPTNSRSVE